MSTTANMLERLRRFFADGSPYVVIDDAIAEIKRLSGLVDTTADAQRALSERDGGTQCAVPTRPGWYWGRVRDFGADEGEPEFMWHVYQVRAGSTLFAEDDGLHIAGDDDTDVDMAEVDDWGPQIFPPGESPEPGGTSHKPHPVPTALGMLDDARRGWAECKVRGSDIGGTVPTDAMRLAAAEIWDEDEAERLFPEGWTP